MFEKWLQENDLSKIEFSGQLFPPASDRGFWSACLKEEEIRNAEEYLNFQWPLIRASQFMRFHTEGDRLAHENPYFQRRTALACLVLGELTEYKGRFLQDLCDGVFLVCEETFWGLSAHIHQSKSATLLPSAEKPYIDLFAAETAEFMVVFRHLFADALEAYCPELLARIDYELDRRIIKPYLEHTDFWWMGYGRKVNNWNPWILSNLLTVFLLQVKDRKVLEAAISKIFTEVDHYYMGMPADGGCDEGPHYWDVAGGRLFALCDRLYVLSGGTMDLFGDEKLKKILAFPLHAHIAGCRFANFADGNSRSMDNFDYNLYVNALRTGQLRLCALAAIIKKAQEEEGSIWMRRIGPLAGELYGRIYSKEIETAEAYVPNEESVLTDTQVAYLRRGDWYCAAKGGFNAESHNHNDVGSFMVYDQGKPVLIDPGCGVYRKETFAPGLRYQIWTMQSCWHNLPTLNGCDQPDGKEFRADSFCVSEGTVRVAFAGAYKEESGVRELLRQLHTAATGITLCDSFTFRQEENQVEENFMTTLEPVVENGAVVLGGQYSLCPDRDCRIEIQTQQIAEDPKLFGDWKTESLYRLRFGFDCGKEGTIQFTLNRR